MAVKPGLLRPIETFEHRMRLGVVAITVLVMGIGLAVGVMTYGLGLPNRGRWDLISEQTVPAAWSSLLFLAAAALLLLRARTVRGEGRREWRWWAALGALAVALAADEFFSFHERTMEPVRELLGTGGLLLYAWVIPGAVALLAIGLTFGGFVRRLAPGLRRSLLVGAALIVTGGFGMEMVGGWWAEEFGTNFGWMLIFTLEEGLEFAGAATIVWGLLREHERLRLLRHSGEHEYSAPSRRTELERSERDSKDTPPTSTIATR